jgi:heat shock protein HslJ
MKAILFAATICVCLFCHCNAGKKTGYSKKNDVSQLSGTWELNYTSGSESGLQELYPGRKPRIFFDVSGKRISGVTGCNSFAGPLKAEGNKIDFTEPMILTKMFCPGDGETIFLDKLKKADTWHIIDGNTLDLTMETTSMLRFTKLQ